QPGPDRRDGPAQPGGGRRVHRLRRGRRAGPPPRRRHGPPRTGPRTPARRTVRHLQPQPHRPVPPGRGPHPGPAHRPRNLTASTAVQPCMRGMRAALAVAVGLGLTACTASKPRPQETYTDLGVTGDIRLAAYTSCEDALGGLRAATRTVVGPYGLGGDMLMADGKAAAAAPKAPGAARE